MKRDAVTAVSHRLYFANNDTEAAELSGVTATSESKEGSVDISALSRRSNKM